MGKEAILRNGERVGFCPDSKGEVCEHAGFQSVIGVRNEGANGNSPRGDIDLGLDEVNLARKFFLGISSNPHGESLTRMNGCAATFGDGEGELHSIHGIDAHEGGLGIDVLANTDVAMTENSVERGGEGVFPHSLFCQVESGHTPLVGSAGLVVFLLRNRPVLKEGIGSFQGFLAVVVVGFGLSDGGGLFRLIDLKE